MRGALLLAGLVFVFGLVWVGHGGQTPAQRYPAIPIEPSSPAEVTAPPFTMPPYVDEHIKGGVAEIAKSIIAHQSATPTTGGPR